MIWPFKRAQELPEPLPKPLAEGGRLAVGLQPDGKVQIQTGREGPEPTTTNVLVLDPHTARWLGSTLLYLSQHPTRNDVARHDTATELPGEESKG